MPRALAMGLAPAWRVGVAAVCGGRKRAFVNENKAFSLSPVAFAQAQKYFAFLIIRFPIAARFFYESRVTA
jgi:hypothetical protein